MRSEFARGGLGVEVSHPCANKKAQGWGAERKWLVERRNADPSTPLVAKNAPSSAQDDRDILEGCR